MAEFIPDTTALVSAPSPMRRHRFVQITCLFATIAHTVATLICVYAAKAIFHFYSRPLDGVCPAISAALVACRQFFFERF
jgi:hypothetical protein